MFHGPFLTESGEGKGGTVEWLYSGADRVDGTSGCHRTSVVDMDPHLSVDILGETCHRTSDVTDIQQSREERGADSMEVVGVPLSHPLTGWDELHNPDM